MIFDPELQLWWSWPLEGSVSVCSHSLRYRYIERSTVCWPQQKVKEADLPENNFIIGLLRIKWGVWGPFNMSSYYCDE